ncbi:MAG: hypothetical protein KKA07_15200 [Bacteroidetes bacterium]|nr:hypothetical protein [Bacteroidota bacterium]MBU1720408.1 hypothetical protein [Bacteroidota bacterium]
MPLDPMLSNAMLGTFRNMAQEIKDKNLSGEDVDKMNATLARMEELAQTNDDMNAFNGTMMQEALYTKFSDFYGRALSAEAQSKQGGAEDYDDAAILKISLDALRDTVKRIKDSKQEAIQMSKDYDPKAAAEQTMDSLSRNEIDSETGRNIDRSEEGIKKLKENSIILIDEELEEKPNAYNNSVEIDVLINDEGLCKPIEELIALGEQEGMTLPRFLRLQIEKGMDKAMEGLVIQREGQEFLAEWNKALPSSPWYTEKEIRKLELFDYLASLSPLKLPNTDELSFGNRRIDYEYEPKIILWQEIVRRWEDILWNLSFWSLAYTPIAPRLKPWCLAADPKKAVIRTQDTAPGIIVQKENLLKKYFDISFMDIFKLDSFEWKVKNHFLGDSQEFVVFLIEEVYPHCRPFNHIPEDVITKRQAMYSEKKEINPELRKPIEKFIAFYDTKFGEGRYVSKYGNPDPIPSNAAPWNWESFKYK